MLIPDDAIELSGNIFAGEYDVKKYTREKPSILDVGANIGAFARWASYRWPGASITCYEPVKSNYSYLVENTKDNQLIKCYNSALGEKEEEKKIYYGVQNCGQCSFHKTDEQIYDGEIVKIVPASSVPYAHIVKIDTEGAEAEIITNLQFKPELFLVEYHSHKIRDNILDYLSSEYSLLEYSMMNKRSGMMKLAINSIMQ